MEGRVVRARRDFRLGTFHHGHPQFQDFICANHSMAFILWHDEPLQASGDIAQPSVQGQAETPLLLAQDPAGQVPAEGALQGPLVQQLPPAQPTPPHRSEDFRIKIRATPFHTGGHGSGIELGKVPKSYEFIEELPRQSSGKIRRSGMVKEREVGWTEAMVWVQNSRK